MEMLHSASCPHAVMFPFAAVGHVRPLLQLARRLAHVYGFKVTVVTTSYIYHKMGLAHASRGGDDIRFIDLQEGFPDSNYTLATMKTLIQDQSTLGPLLRALLERLHNKTNPVTCVISDVVFYEPHRAALDLAIPSVAFSTQCVMAVAAKYYGLRLVDEGLIPLPKEPDEAHYAQMVTCVPGLHPMKLKDFYAGVLVHDLTNSFFQFVVGEISASLHQREWILSNAVTEFESSVIEAFHQDAGVKVITVGPLAITPMTTAGSPVDEDETSAFWPEETNCMEWLSKQMPTSVIYVSFGSLASIPASALEELLLGLEGSQVPFLMVMRPDGVHTDSQSLAKQIQERTRERALFISWAPQLKVLSHPAIAGFLTHCGWNSLLESVSMGVPMLCHPFLFDQPMTSRYIVSVWKNGLELNKGGDGSLDRVDVAEKVKALAAKESVIRANAKAWRAVATRAVERGGSSQKNLVAFVGDMYRRAGAACDLCPASHDSHVLTQQNQGKDLEKVGEDLELQEFYQ